MPGYNIYRIKDYDGLVNKLESVGMLQAGSMTIDGYQYIFYISQGDSVKSEVKRKIGYRSFFQNIQADEIENINYFGCLLVFNQNLTYAIPLGKTHFYLSRYADLGFGIKLAERICDPDETHIKKARFFTGNKSKVISSYKRGTKSDFQGGESVVYYKGKILDQEKWGKQGVFGYSAKLIIDKPIEEIHKVLDMVEDTIHEGNRTLLLPFVKPIKEEAKLEQLNLELAQKLSDTEVEISEIGLSGIQILFNSQYTYRLYLQGNKRSTITDNIELSIANIQRFISENSITVEDALEYIKVEILSDNGNSFSKSIKFFIEYTNEEHCGLIDGDWYIFNDSFLEYLDKSVDEVEVVNNVLDINGYQKENEILHYLINNYEYINGHCEMVQINKYKLEQLDLYKDNTGFFVKRGSLSKLNYVIDQSLGTIKFLKDMGKKIVIHGEEKKIDSMCLWLIYKRSNPIAKLSETNSFIFKVKLDMWLKECRDANIKPIVYLNYY